VPTKEGIEREEEKLEEVQQAQKNLFLIIFQVTKCVLMLAVLIHLILYTSLTRLNYEQLILKQRLFAYKLVTFLHG